MTSALCFLALIIVCITVPFMVSDEFSVTPAMRRLRQMCLEFLALAAAFLLMAFWTFLDSNHWLVVLTCLFFSSVAAICCLTTAGMIAFRSLFPPAPEPDVLSWEAEDHL